MKLEEIRAEAIPLMAEDIRRGRIELGITSARAAKRLGVSVPRYWALEKGCLPNTQHSVNCMLTAARRLGLKSVRLSYVPEVDRHINVVLSKGEPLMCFTESLEGNLSEFMQQQYFVNPASVVQLVDQLGLRRVIESRNFLYKQLVELWVTALFTVSLSENRDYFVRPVENDPPDAEILVVDREDFRASRIRVEIAQFGAYSGSVFEVLGKKLQKKYQDQTRLIVFVEQWTALNVRDLNDFIRRNNVHDQRIAIIGAAGDPGQFQVIPWELVSEPTPDETALAEVIQVDKKDASKGHREFAGVIYDPPYNSRFSRIPVFVREITLHR